MDSPRPSVHQDAVLYALREVVEQCGNVIAAHENRADGAPGLTLNEGQEIGVLWVRMEDLREARLGGRAESR
jgi:hypothetical protein